jgi:lipid-A-disaccharide synthase
VVKELLQYSLNKKNLVRELRSILPGGEHRERIMSEYMLLAEKLGPSGASDRVAEDMVGRLTEGKRLKKIKDKR